MKCPVHNIPDCSPLLNGCSRLTQPEFAGDGKNPLDRIDIGADDNGYVHAICDCNAVLVSDRYSINLQDLVITVQTHAGECPLHKANLAAIQYRRNRD